ncbi:MAG: mannose-1-phosphate guanylyltransferase [Candidatus Chisholmbacteria bacterium]|nr:mannose-1-phosphate guanylyltransferase [Candidatus Chisholmbacteria bacterium]
MKAVIFAGGAGTRMWPVSRKSSPKQFEKIIGDKSTLQLAVERLRPEFDWSNIYIATGKEYSSLVRRQIPLLPQPNLIAEPEMRDVAAAVGYVAAIFAKTSPHEPFIILWSDHLVAQVEVFKKLITLGFDYVSHHQDKILFIGQKARFANQNVGWIATGKVINHLKQFNVHEFVSLHYRPTLQETRVFFHRPNFSWNPGYFIVTPKFLISLYQRFMPDMYRQLILLQKSYSTPNHLRQFQDIYPKLEKIHFDKAILERLDPQHAVVVSADLGWSDIGTWEALKEALQTHPSDNLTKGQVVTHQTQNSLIYNYTSQLVATLDLEGMLVIVTPDVIMVCPQESVPDIKKVIQELEATGNSQYT